jgi:hypothetical protein
MDEKVIPRSSLDILPPFVKFGTVDIVIEALDAGAAGNVSANTITVADGDAYAVSNPQPTTGGEIKKFAVVTQSDYGLAAGRADDELRKRAMEKVLEWKKTEAAKGLVVYGPVTKVTNVTAPAGLVGSEPKDGIFEIRVIGTATAYSVPEAEPRATAIAKLKQQADTEHDINETAAGVDVIIGPTLEENGVRWRVRGSTLQYPRLKEAPLRTALAGRELEEATDVVEGQGLELRTITIWPYWWPRFPFFDLRLQIKVDDAAPATSASP